MPIYFGPDRINGVSVTLPTGSGSLTDTSDATLNSSSQLLKDVSAYSKGKRYIGSIPTRSAGDVSVSGASVSFPAGYYDKSQSISVNTASLGKPDISINGNGLITSRVEQGSSGYVAASSASNSLQLPVQETMTIMPSIDEQTAVQAGKYVIGDVKIAAVQTETKNIINNGIYTPTAGKFFSSVVVNVPSDSVSLQGKAVFPTETQQVVSPDDGYDGLSMVTVNPISATYVGSAVPTKGATAVIPSSISQMAISSGTYATGNITVSAVPSETKEITSNGTYMPSDGKWFSSVTVNVSGDSFNTQTKSVTPTESEQIIAPDAGYDGLSSVIVGAISSTYVGSGVPRKSAATIDPSEVEQTIASDQYLTGTQTISAISPTYVGSGVSRKGATAITPSTSKQTAVVAGTYVTGDITVHAMQTGSLSTPSINTSTGVVTSGIATSGYLSTSDTKALQLTTKSSATITPGTTDQTIAAGRYLTGTQTIKGDSNLVPENIISGKSIFGVAGNVTIQKYYTGTTDPPSSLGNDGDIYLKE